MNNIRLITLVLLAGLAASCGYGGKYCTQEPTGSAEADLLLCQLDTMYMQMTELAQMAANDPENPALQGLRERHNRRSDSLTKAMKQLEGSLTGLPRARYDEGQLYLMSKYGPKLDSLISKQLEKDTAK